MFEVHQADLTSADAVAVARLVGDYLRQTELEKSERGLADYRGGEALPGRYQAECDHPEVAFADCQVLLASWSSDPVGVAIVRSGAGGSELKRFWVDPRHRGRRIGSRLLAETIAAAGDPLRLSVWRWREPAIRSYEKAGFVEVASWESRPDLLCFEHRHSPLIELTER